MSEGKINEAMNSLLTLWRDVEWWEEQGLSQVRPTLKAAADAASQLMHERDEARAEVASAKDDAWRHYNRASVAEKERDEARAEVEKARQLNAEYEEREKIKAIGRARARAYDCQKVALIELAECEELKIQLENQSLRRDRNEANAELKRLRDEYTAATNHYNATNNKLLTERDEVERLKNYLPDATKMIRPEPSRLEIAAMMFSGWMAHKECEGPAIVHSWWLQQADALIEAAKGGAE